MAGQTRNNHNALSCLPTVRTRFEVVAGCVHCLVAFRSGVSARLRFVAMPKLFYNRDVRALIYFTRELPGLSNELELAGFQIYEALALSEVFYLVQQHPSAHIVLDHTVEDEAANEIAQHYSTLRLTRNSKAADVLWELSLPSIEDSIQ